MAEQPQDEQRSDEKDRAAFRGEDESSEVEGHMKTREPAEVLRSRGEDEMESPEEGRLASRQPEERS